MFSSERGCGGGGVKDAGIGERIQGRTRGRGVKGRGKGGLGTRVGVDED